MLTIKDLYGLKSQKGRDVGIEIEMEGSTLNIGGTDHWSLHDDGSLRPNPERMEYVLTRPVPYKDVPSVLRELQGTLSKAGAKLNPSDRCGVHIHINCQDLTPMQVISFISTYLILEEPMVKWCGEEREGNLFALRAKDAEWIVSSLIQSIQEGGFTNFNSEMRYSSVNVAALLKFGSLEFRALNTPKDFSIIETWVDMLMKIKNYAISFKHPRDIVEAVSAGGFTKFPKQVLGDMAELIMCKGSAVMVSEGVRRVQEIAYADLLFKKKEKPQQEKVIVDVEAQPITYPNNTTFTFRTRNWIIEPPPPPAPADTFNRDLPPRDDHLPPPTPGRDWRPRRYTLEEGEAIRDRFLANTADAEAMQAYIDYTTRRER